MRLKKGSKQPVESGKGEGMKMKKYVKSELEIRERIKILDKALEDTSDTIEANHLAILLEALNWVL